MAKNKDLELFQWENVLTLANKAVDKKTKNVLGPSNLSSVCYILRSEASLWTHVWKLDSHSNFGSGQGRGRLWGSSFRLSMLKMDEYKAHELLDALMNQFAGVAPSNPESYLLPNSHPSIQASLSKCKFHGQSAGDFLDVAADSRSPSDVTVSIKALFRSNGTLPLDASKKRKVCSAGHRANWVEKHEKAFAALGEETLFSIEHMFLMSNALGQH